MRTFTAAPPSFEDRGDGRAAARSAEGFTLVEMLIALFILTFGLLAAGQMMYAALSSESLARSKGSAALAAQNKLEFLSDLYSQDPSAADLTDGNHGPEQVQLLNPAGNNVLNRFNVTWTVGAVADPRPGMTLKAKQVSVTVTPITAGDVRNFRARFNKIVTVSAIFSMRIS